MNIFIFSDASSNSSDSSGDTDNLFYQTNDSNLTPLFLAIKEDLPKSVSKLLSAGCDMANHGQDDNNTAVHSAADLNRAACLEAMREDKTAAAEWKQLLTAKNKFKMIPVMLTEDTASIQVTYYPWLRQVYSFIHLIMQLIK